MNQDYVVRAYVAWNLEEALGELNRIVAGMTPNAEVDEIEFQVALTHVYDHLNTAWNSRNATDAETESLGSERLDRWSKFPDDLNLTG